MKNSAKFICLLVVNVCMISCGGHSQKRTVNTSTSTTTTTTTTTRGNEVGTSRQTQGSTGSNVTTSEANEFMEHHNMARNEVGVGNLKWNPEVARVAQDFANKLAKRCSFEHSDDSRYGENLFMGGGRTLTAIDGSKSWYSEKSGFSYAKFNGSNSGHYTQMIWQKTTDVGVGTATCTDGSIIIVANYFPRGNTLGEYPYKR